MYSMISVIEYELYANNTLIKVLLYFTQHYRRIFDGLTRCTHWVTSPSTVELSRSIVVLIVYHIFHEYVRYHVIHSTCAWFSFI